MAKYKQSEDFGDVYYGTDETKNNAKDKGYIIKLIVPQRLELYINGKIIPFEPFVEMEVGEDFVSSPDFIANRRKFSVVKKEDK